MAAAVRLGSSQALPCAAAAGRGTRDARSGGRRTVGAGCVAPPCVNTQAPTATTLPHQLDATRSTATGPLAQAWCAGAVPPPGPGPPHPPRRRRPRWPPCDSNGPSEGAATRDAARRGRKDAARTATWGQAAAAGGRGRRCAPPSTQWPHRRCGRGAWRGRAPLPPPDDSDRRGAGTPTDAPAHHTRSRTPLQRARRADTRNANKTVTRVRGTPDAKKKKQGDPRMPRAEPRYGCCGQRGQATAAGPAPVKISQPIDAGRRGRRDRPKSHASNDAGWPRGQRTIGLVGWGGAGASAALGRGRLPTPPRRPLEN